MIILGLTLVAAIYAGSIFLFSTPKDNMSGSISDENSAHEFVTELARSIAQHHLTKTEQIVLEKTQRPWPDQPFVTGSLPSAESSAPTQTSSTKDDEGEFNFTGYVKINSEEYETGDRIAGSPYTVRSISPGQVLLGDADNRTRTVPMAEDVVQNAAPTSQ